MEFDFEFTNDEKAKLFDRIASVFYNKNFGQISKADIKFDIFIRKLIGDNQNKDVTIDYSKCSDYIISKKLGITQQRVRNLKEKNQLVHPIEYNWKNALANLTQNARYESETHKITINIPDPNLYYEIQNFIENQGGYVEAQLNRKVLKIRAEYYIELIIAIEPENNRKVVIKKIKDVLKQTYKDGHIFDERKIGKELIECTSDITSILANIKQILSPDNAIAKSLIMLLSKEHI